LDLSRRKLRPRRRSVIPFPWFQILEPEGLAADGDFEHEARGGLHHRGRAAGHGERQTRPLVDEDSGDVADADGGAVAEVVEVGLFREEHELPVLLATERGADVVLEDGGLADLAVVLEDDSAAVADVDARGDLYHRGEKGEAVGAVDLGLDVGVLLLDLGEDGRDLGFKSGDLRGRIRRGAAGAEEGGEGEK